MHTDNVQKQIEEGTWEDIAHMAHAFHIEIEGEGNGTKKFRKELCLVKHILHEHLCNPEHVKDFVNISLFIRMAETINKFEKTCDRHSIKKRGFLLFLKAVLNRIKKEKLRAEKPLERKVEFKKMKDAMENSHGNIQLTGTH